MSVDERAREDILALSDTILETREAVTRIERKQNQHGRILSALQQGLSDVRAETTDLRQGLSEVRGEVAGLRQGQESLNGMMVEVLALLRER
jgi:chromosome segregation ATPase